MISPRARVKAKTFVESLEDLALSAKVRRRLEKDLARAMTVYRDEIARFVGNSWGHSQWIETSRAIELRIRKLM